PSCPDPSYAAFHGYLDTPPDVTCPPCTCGPSVGYCGPSDGLIALETGCPGAGNFSQFLPPGGLDGTCQATGITSSSASVVVYHDQKLAGGPGAGCEVIPSQSPPHFHGMTKAMVCHPRDYLAPGDCPAGSGQLCALANLDGFSVCLWVQDLSITECP